VRRCRRRGARKGLGLAEWLEEWLGAPSRLERLKEHHELPQRGLGQNPGQKRIWCILGVTEHFCLQDRLSRIYQKRKIVIFNFDPKLSLYFFLEHLFQSLYGVDASDRFVALLGMWTHRPTETDCGGWAALHVTSCEVRWWRIQPIYCWVARRFGVVDCDCSWRRLSNESNDEDAPRHDSWHPSDRFALVSRNCFSVY